MKFVPPGRAMHDVSVIENETQAEPVTISKLKIAEKDHNESMMKEVGSKVVPMLKDTDG